MNIDVKVHTDVGTSKKVNQDAVLVKQAMSEEYGKIVFTVLCDGMGGLSCGEIASSSVVKRMDSWFKGELPVLLNSKNQTEVLSQKQIHEKTDERIIKKVENQWKSIVGEMNLKIQQYGMSQAISLGTTIVCVLFIKNHFIAMNVGDSRFYRIRKEEVEVISHDHSLVQREIEQGKITKEQAKCSEKKSILLQCIGASNEVIPEFYFGDLTKESAYLLCSDGFWRELNESDFVELGEGKTLEEMTEKVKLLGERDNISGIVIRTEKC